jgi:hypothetical protein
MKKQLVILSAVLLIQAVVVSVFAQQKPKAGELVSGVVFDDEGPMLFVNVMERDPANRIVAHGITDMEGNFSFRLVNPDHRIEISYIGYETVSIPIDTTYYEIKMVCKGDPQPVNNTSDIRTASGLPIPPREADIDYPTIDMDSLWQSGLASVIPPKVYNVDMRRSSIFRSNDPLNINVPGLEFQVDSIGLRHIVSLPEQYYTDIENGNGYVDLGLSVKWAAYNIGADSPEQTGDRYAWGEVTTKPDYTWQNYRFNTGGNGFWDVWLSKYNSDGNLGRIDKFEVLEPEDDAAHVKWGGRWRTPTANELQELANNSTFIWAALNGREGYLIISGKQGYTDRFIFLPTTRRRSDGLGSDGYYWSSTLNPIKRQGSYNPGPSNCYALHILNIDSFEVSIDLENCRCWGLTIRPVCP